MNCPKCNADMLTCMACGPLAANQVTPSTTNTAAPSPTAALQAGVGRFVACRCVSERDRELCMTKDECSKVYAYSDTATKEPTK